MTEPVSPGILKVYDPQARDTSSKKSNRRISFSKEPVTVLILKDKPLFFLTNHDASAAASSSLRLFNIGSDSENEETQSAVFQKTLGQPQISDEETLECFIREPNESSLLSKAHLQSVRERVSFHTYFIHKKEKTGPLKDDPRYGEKAFFSKEGFDSTATEKIRAVQRTLIETYLKKLELAVSTKSYPAISLITKKLESIDWNIKDRTHPEAANPAFELFRHTYEEFKESHKRYPRLINPDEPCFNNDFGKLAYEKRDRRISSQYLVSSIAAFRENLEKTWEIPSSQSEFDIS